MIREIYVVPQFRKSGAGRQLVAIAEKAMKSFEPKGFYLTCDGLFGFWTSLGYENTGEIEEANNSIVFAKSC
jgi:GNAT superfamily N-acetyltransferase